MKPFKRKKQPLARQRPTSTAGRVSGARSFSYYGLQRQQAARATTKDAKSRKKSTSRNRTSGSTAATGAKNAKLDQLLHTFGAVVLGIVLLICLITVLQIDTKPRIIIINDEEGVVLHSEQEYADVATNAIRGSLFNANKVTINTRDISTSVEQAFPEVKSAAMALPLVGHRPTVYIELTRPVMVLNTASQSVIIDNKGQALVKAQDVANVANFNLPSVYDQSQIELAVGDVVLSSTAVTFVQEVLAQLSAQDLTVRRMVLPAGAEELDIYLKGDSYFTKYNLHETNARQQVGTFLAVRQKLSKQKGVPSEYIDVRLTGRAYYK